MGKKTLRFYYKRMLYHNRSISARALDYLAFRLILLLSLWIFFSHLKNPLSGGIMSLIGVLAFSAGAEAVKERRLSRFIRKKQWELSCSYWLRQLVLLDAPSFSSLVRDLVHSMGYRIKSTASGALICEYGGKPSLVFPVQYHESYALSPQDILDMYHIADRCKTREALIIATCPVSEEARRFLHRLQKVNFHILSRESLLKAADLAGMLPSPEETEAALLAELEEQEMSLRKLKTQALYSGKSKAYLLSGFALLIASYFSGFNLYYPLVSAVCFLMAFISHYHARLGVKG